MHSNVAHIHLDNFKKNIAHIRHTIGSSVKLCLPVKANAYGHGNVIIAQAAQKIGVDCLGVASAKEGVALRKNGITLPILCFSLCPSTELEFIVQYDLSPFVCDVDYIDALAACAQKHNAVVHVHLKIDTGMARVGCSANETLSLATHIAHTPSVKLAGVCTHFAVADSRTKEDISFTEQQITLFNNTVKTIQEAGIDTGIVHAANSGGAFYFPQAHYDMVRVGIAAYGYLDVETEKHLLPVMSLTSCVSTIKSVQKGQTISYGRTWVAPADTDIATIPIGYGDGLLRRFSPGLHVHINGCKFPVVGRICMDQCMIDLGKNHGVKRWDTVTIFGQLADATLDSNANTACATASTLADTVNTISYEVLTSITERVERVVVQDVQ